MLKGEDRTAHPVHHASAQTPLWQQLQGAAALLLAVRAGRSMTAELERVPPHLRPGVQALGFHALRWLGRAEALRQQLVSRPPPPEADALLCVALALASEVDESMYTEYTLVDQAVQAAKQGEATQHQASFINGCLRRFLRERAALLAVCERKPQAVWNHPQWWVDRVRKDHPEAWQTILQANNSRPPLTLRVNTRQTKRADYLLALQAAGVEAAPVGAQGILLAGAGAVTRLPGYAEGHFSVQDAGAQLAAPLLLDGLQAPAGQPLRLLDACAAPGGKTAHLLELADAELLAQIIGRELKSAFPAKHQRVEGAKPNLVVNSLSGNGFSDVSIEAYPGQIIGIAGVVGNGQSEFLKALSGQADWTWGATLTVPVVTPASTGAGSGRAPRRRWRSCSARGSGSAGPP